MANIDNENAIREYVKNRHSHTKNERMKLFKEVATSFGPADEETIAFRKECANLGCKTVFRSKGISREKALEILKHEDTAKIKKNPDRAL